MKKLVLRPPFDRLWADCDPFAAVQNMDGEIVRDKEGRQTRRCEIAEGVFYRKVHTGVGWGEIVKNLVQGRIPVVDASNEWLAIERLRSLGIDTLEAVAFGVRGHNPATRLSFLVTRELTQALSTAVFTEDWRYSPPPPALRRAMVERIADIARTLHNNGINHRDLYLCHFLLDIGPGIERLGPDNLRFFLVDLHRAQMRKKVPRRWWVKDVASIYFSALDIGLHPRDMWRFLRVYFDQPLKQIVRRYGRELRQIERKARKLYRRDFGREPQLPLLAPR